ncbi:hypothetical protein MNJPNG_06360 [Cupriavidus oxalaticus]|uniref:hypothetical protein n=1 Tax=Cupriavidus oxalaticus TaxID=96344 RepID=UPI003F73E42B
MEGEDLDAFLDDFGDEISVASLALTARGIIDQGWKDVFDGTVRASSWTLTGRADVFGALTKSHQVVVTSGASAGTYRPYGEPAPIGDGAFVAIELHKELP